MCFAPSPCVDVQRSLLARETSVPETEILEVLRAREDLQSTGIGDGVAAAWRRMWRKRDADSTGGTDGSVWTTGVTYRGYLGAHNGVSTSWMSEQQMKETQALLRMAAAAGRLGAWGVQLAGMKWVWSDEVKAIHEVPADYEPDSQGMLNFYTPESQELLIEGFERCATERIVACVQGF